MALGCVTSFLRLKDVTKTHKRMRRSLSIGESSSVQWRKVEDFKCVLVVYCVLNQNRSAPVCELLSNNSLFVGQLYEDKSLALRARDFNQIVFLIELAVKKLIVW